MIFLSYAKEDSERASKIFSLVNRIDRPIFYDKDALIPGMDWELEIEEKLRKCILILILCSKNSINKEGFIQREIRLALKRSENMPDGRIFIIPIRFDNIDIPHKLAKYQWIEILGESDYYDVQFFLDIIWERLTGNKIELTTNSINLNNVTNNLFRENVVILLQGKNTSAEPIYTYLKIPLWKLQALRRTMDQQLDFQPSDYGIVLEAGKGEVSETLAAKMTAEHNMISIPSANKKEKDEYSKYFEEYSIAFYEAYKSILGEHVELPLIEKPPVLSESANPLKEGIKAGLEKAKRLKIYKNNLIFFLLLLTSIPYLNH
jgi:hypothetical protein